MKMYKSYDNRIIIPLYIKNNVLYIASKQGDEWSLLSYDESFLSDIKNDYDIFNGEITEKRKLIKKVMK